jgi:hypothetical protein
MPTSITFEISKLEAAKKQLQTAITLWFCDVDPISAHSLAYAAYEVIQAVSKAKNPNRPDLLLDSTNVRPDQRKAFNEAFRAAGNFFKHGDRDPLATLTFSPEITEIFIYYAIWGFHFSGEKLPDEFTIFEIWIAITLPHMLSEDVRKVLVSRGLIDEFEAMRGMQKQQFFEGLLKTFRANTL